MPLSRLTRFVTLLLAAIQFAAPALASVAEGSFSSRIGEQRMHVEEYGQNACTPPHAADCAICRFLGDNAADQPTAATLAVASVPQVTPIVRIAEGTGTDRQGFDARGPPAIAG
jgi:hypothetical protein